jgi:transcriptional regulator with XRE-family HTH domain
MNEKDLRNILGRNIKKYRGYRKFTQAEFAERIDISIPFLSDIENGKKWVSSNTLTKMADTLNIAVYELLKPGDTLPDNAINIVESYTADIYSTFANLLNTLRNDYINNLTNR